MLPSFFDIQTMIVIMWVVIIVSGIVALMVIKSLDKPGLRVLVTLIVAVLMVSSYSYTKMLNECETSGTQCTFFGLTVQQDDGFVN